MKNLVLIESTLWYLLRTKYYLLITEVCPYILDNLDWMCISMYLKLPEEFIIKFQEHVDWHCISKYQKLSEEFIDKYHDKVCWKYIFKRQKLSRDFIDKYHDHDKNDWYYHFVGSNKHRGSCALWGPEFHSI